MQMGAFARRWRPWHARLGLASSGFAWEDTGVLRPFFKSSLCGFVLWIAPIGHAGNWPQWRGPEGTGVSVESGWPLKWGEKQNVRWRVALPDRGNSTPVVWGDRVFVTQALEKEGRRTLMCFAKSNGRVLWQSGVTYEEHEPTNGENPYCSSSAATDGTHVLAYFGSAGLYCYDFGGNELWHRETGKVDSWQGSGSSPIIHDGLCYLNAGPGTKA